MTPREQLHFDLMLMIRKYNNRKTEQQMKDFDREKWEFVNKWCPKDLTLENFPIKKEATVSEEMLSNVVLQDMVNRVQVQTSLSEDKRFYETISNPVDSLGEVNYSVVVSIETTENFEDAIAAHKKAVELAEKGILISLKIDMMKKQV